MNKILALENEEHEDEIRFKETMAHREQILKRRGQIEVFGKKIVRLEREIKMDQPKTFEVETEIELLQTEIDSITKNIRRQMENVLRNEEKLKKSKESFQKFLRAKIQENQEILNTNRTLDNFNTKPSTNTGSSNDADDEAAKRVWTLKGENLANSIILEYQDKKIEEMAEIAQRVGTPFIDDQDDCETESSNYEFV